MKKIISLIVLIGIGMSAFAQPSWLVPMSARGYKYKNLWIDSSLVANQLFRLPGATAFPPLVGSMRYVYDADSTKLTEVYTGYTWVKQGGGGSSTSDTLYFSSDYFDTYGTADTLKLRDDLYPGIQRFLDSIAAVRALEFDGHLYADSTEQANAGYWLHATLATNTGAMSWAPLVEPFGFRFNNPSGRIDFNTYKLTVTGGEGIHAEANIKADGYMQAAAVISTGIASIGGTIDIAPNGLNIPGYLYGSGQYLQRKWVMIQQPTAALADGNVNLEWAIRGDTGLAPVMVDGSETFLTFTSDRRILMGGGRRGGDSSAILDLFDTTKGFLPPRWTGDQRDSIASPAQGLIGYQTNDDEGLYGYIAGGWKRFLNSDDLAAITEGINIYTANDTLEGFRQVWGNGYTLALGTGASNVTSLGAFSVNVAKTGSVGINILNGGSTLSLDSSKAEIYGADSINLLGVVRAAVGSRVKAVYMDTLTGKLIINDAASGGSSPFTASGSDAYIMGNVGIGTSTISYPLEVRSASLVTAHFSSSLSTGQATFYLENDRGGFASYGGFLYGGSASSGGNLFGRSRVDRLFMFADGVTTGMNVGTLNSSPFAIGTNGVERMVVKSSGIVNLSSSSTPSYANNAAAIAGGLVAGDIYLNGDILQAVH